MPEGAVGWEGVGSGDVAQNGSDTPEIMLLKLGQRPARGSL